MKEKKIDASLRKKKKLSNENLPHFQWELRSYQRVAETLFADYKMSPPRNKTVDDSRLMALDCVLANITNGPELIIPNFSKIKAGELGFSRSVFLDVLNHLEKVALIGREGKNDARSIIAYSSRIRRYLPTQIVFQPVSPLIVKIKGEGVVLLKVDTVERRKFKERMKNIWAYYQQHEILTGIDRSTFELFNQVETEVYRKKPLVFPDPTKIFPQIIFNDRDLTKGGRMYGAFWIGEKSLFRRVVTIDGELTSDIDGKGMHVQLLYRRMGAKMPEGDPYIFSDDRRPVAKNLMVLMMNTKFEMPPYHGRRAVARTYRREKGKEHKTEELIEMILELESYHHLIAEHFYKPNWGDLQKTEAGIMLSIMEAGMADNVVVLPVHDGCLCQRQHEQEVLSYFSGEGIEAEENRKHLQELPVERAMALLAAQRKFAQSA